ncbi:hypothetical protein GpartN1_g3236.t1 [Galdieria partita]|uniref:Thioredoxin domain-containing protein n=1 Tax=Galdieria partita TaxID=83374 RepID=A0A9C7PW52_9RHOD|nr:hypothetical protein GpartN1_g3236.t1 [Galdieria partita]
MTGSRRKQAVGEPYLLEFHGTECDHCVDMLPLVHKIEKELGVTMLKLEVWHNPRNNRLLQKLDSSSVCGGVPFFYNRISRQFICGATTYKNLLAWAKSEGCASFLPPETAQGQEEDRSKSAFERLRSKGMERLQERSKPVTPGGSSSDSTKSQSAATSENKESGFLAVPFLLTPKKKKRSLPWYVCPRTKS